MKLIGWTLFSVAILLAVTQAVWAIALTGSSGIGNAPMNNNISGTIERGGTITDINLERKTIAVDGISYPFAYSIAVTAADNLQASQHNLRKGMRIRFVTAKDIARRQEKVTEILILGRPSQK